MAPKRIGIIGVDGIAALHFTAPIETLLAAALDDGYGGRIPCYAVSTIALSTAAFTCESGVRCAAEETLASAPSLDTIIIPGGSAWRNHSLGQTIAEWLLVRAAETRRIAAIGTGVFPLAASGLLQRRAVTVPWRYATELSRRYPELRVDHRKALLKDAPFLTCTGVTAGMNLALALIEEDYGPHLARAVADETCIIAPAETPTVNLDTPPRPIDRFGELVGWVMRNLDSDLSVEVLARRACMSKDTFSRAFKSVFGVPPSEFVENLRLNEARRRLAAPHRTLQTVAASVGFSSPDKFSSAFERRFGVRPHRFLESTPRVLNRPAAAA